MAFNPVRLLEEFTESYFWTRRFRAGLLILREHLLIQSLSLVLGPGWMVKIIFAPSLSLGFYFYLALDSLLARHTANIEQEPRSSLSCSR